jgi:hypothetical protein
MAPPVAGGADSSGSKVRLECKKGQQPGRAVHAFASVGAGTRGGASSHPPFSSTPSQGSCEKQAKRGATSGRAGGDHSPIPSISPELRSTGALDFDSDYPAHSMQDLSSRK